MTDIFRVTSMNWSDLEDVRVVIAADEDDARRTHEKHYPEARIVAIRKYRVLR